MRVDARPAHRSIVTRTRAAARALRRLAGIPFERAIKFHRVLGRLCWLLVTIHLALWQIKWLLEGIFMDNLTTIRALQVTKCTSGGQQPCVVRDETGAVIYLASAFHPDNFTIVMVNVRTRPRPRPRRCGARAAAPGRSPAGTVCACGT